MERREVGAILVEDRIWGREYALQQERLAMALGGDVGKLLGGGETAGALRPEGVLRGIARSEMRDGEVEFLDGFRDGFVCTRADLDDRGAHALQCLGEGAATGEGLWKRTGDADDAFGVGFSVVQVAHWPTLPAQTQFQRVPL